MLAGIQRGTMKTMAIEQANLALQFAASILMASDYFFSLEERNARDATIRRVATPIRFRTRHAVRDFRRNVVWDVLWSCALGFVVGWVFITTQLPPSLPWEHKAPFVILGPVPVFIFFLVIRLGAFSTAVAICKAARFIVECKKGRLFGIGFLLLLSSFALRFASL